MGLIEIVLALAVIAIAGFLLMKYLGATGKTVERLREQRPLAGARLSADQATLASIQAAVRTYQAQHGRWPADREAVVALLAGPPRFQCPGNDFDYDPASGNLTLRIVDAGRC
jgi:type II secretory pathway pseudopilin PulG